MWEYLFSFEVYNLIFNSRRGNTKDEQPNTAGLEMIGGPPRPGKKLSWIGYCVMGGSFGFLQALKMYDKPPHSANIADPGNEAVAKQEDLKFNEGFTIRQVREHDLLLMTVEPVDLRGNTDIKQILTADFLRKTLVRSSAMLAFVA